MRAPAVAVDHLTKDYILGDGSRGYATFREALTRALTAPFRSAARLGQPTPDRAPAQAFRALDDLSFTVSPGESVAIVGRNGAGKSTVLKILSRITEPSAGQVAVRGRVASLLEVGTGFHPELSGRENIYLNGAILGMRKAEIDRKFDEIVAFSEIEEFLDTPVKRYSSGMYVRLAFAVAAHLEPEILIVDEVLAVGDFAFQKKCLGKMQEVVTGDGRTILFVSHNMGALSQLCDRGILLEKGAVTAIGPIEDVLGRYFDPAEGRGSRADFPVAPGKFFQWVSAEVVRDDGSSGSEFSCEEPIMIRLELEVRRPVTSTLMYVSLATMDGIQVLTSEFRDRGSTVVEQLGPGRHTFGIRIPARLLAPGSYAIGITAHKQFNPSPDQGNPYFDAHQRCCEFTLRDLSYSRHSRPGVLGILLPWEHHHQGGPPGDGPGA
jgi:lipopolysaccharide transport system ATP-binding protein